MIPLVVKSRLTLGAPAIVGVIMGLILAAPLVGGCHVGPGLWCPKPELIVEERHHWGLSPTPTSEHRDTLAELARVAAAETLPAPTREAAALEIQRFVGGTPTMAATAEATAKLVIAQAQAQRKDILERAARFQAEVKAQGGCVVSAGPSGQIDVIAPTTVTKIEYRQVVVSRLVDKLLGFPIGVLVLVPAAAMFGLAAAGAWKKWEWAVAVGVALGSMFGCVGAMLLMWELLTDLPPWVWIIVVLGGSLMGIAAALVIRVRKRTAAFREVVAGAEVLKSKADLSEAEANDALKSAQSQTTRDQVTAILPEAKAAALAAASVT